MPGEEFPKDAAHDFRLFLVDHKSSVQTLVVAEEVLVVQAVTAIGELLSLTPADVLGNAPALLLGQ